MIVLQFGSHHLKALPDDVRLGWLSRSVSMSSLRRLTADQFAFRPVSSHGDWYIGTLEELLPLMRDTAIPPPYIPSQPNPLYCPDDLLSDLGL